MHWHMCDKDIRIPMWPAYFVRETVEQILTKHYEGCPCGAWDIIECDDLMCIVDGLGA